MTEEQFAEALALRKSGMTIKAAAEAVGVTEGVLSGHFRRRGKGIGKRTRRKLSADDIADAVARYGNGESWNQIAKSYGVCWKTLVNRAAPTVATPDTVRDVGPQYVVGIEPHKPRQIRAVIKPKPVVMDLARQFVSGQISRAEFVQGISA